MPPATAPDPENLTALVQGLEREGFDSLWVSERATGPSADPVSTLAFTAAATKRIKLGMAVMALPGRQPALVAKEMASLDRLSGGRLLPAFGLGIRNVGEQQAFGVERTQRAAMLNEALPLLRRFWAEDEVSHDGTFYHYDKLRILPKPAKGGFDVWLGGASDAELRRTGRLSDGWLASFVAPAEGERARKVIQQAAAEADREIEDEHFGAVVLYRRGPLGPDVEARFARLRQVRGGEVGLDEVIPPLEALEAHLKRLVEAGLSKFVLAPVGPPDDWAAELADVRDAALGLQTRR